jgi:Flp pilus assembly protein TadB
MILLAALAGAAVAGGLVLLIRGLFPPARDPGKPPGLFAAPRLTAGGRRQGLIAVAAGLVVYVLTGWPVGGIAAIAAVIYLPKLGTRAERQRTAMLEGLEQWTRRLADMVSASRGLEEALSASARTAPAAIAGPVGRLAEQLSSRGGAEAALRAFADEIDDPAGDRIAAALIIATGRRGGAARDVLVALAALLAKDVAARRDIDAEQAEHRTTVKWICILIVGFTIFAVLNHSYSAPFGTPAGQVVLALVAGLYAAGLTWLHRLGKIKTASRFLSADGAPARRLAEPAQLPAGPVPGTGVVARRLP